MRSLLLLVAVLTAGCTPARLAPAHTELRVLVYNIHAGKDAGGADNLERVAAMITASGADIVLLQEVDSATRRAQGVDQLAALAVLTRMHGAFGSTIEWQGGSFGLAVLSRHPIGAHALIPLRTDPPQPRVDYAREPRGVLVATVTTPHGPLAVMNTHLDAGRDGQWRRQEVVHLLTVADSLRSADARLILGGDLNARPSSPELQPLTEAGLRDAWIACGQGEGFSFPATAPDRRIDYLFLDSGFDCQRARVLPDEASDHRALLVTLRLP
ncbi:MAG: endonuclease/exonuclease/phosphatase family protein [Gemmatimonadaceae bacterium]|nr:endonuclease/exonuclease/phosphatase family protein [Gemmatimonadaceae bacterium]